MLLILDEEGVCGMYRFLFFNMLKTSKAGDDVTRLQILYILDILGF